MSPGVRIESGRLKNRLPAVRRGRHFPQAGNRAFSQVVRLFSVAVHRLPFRKALTSENCGFVLCTKCGPCRTARKQFSKGLRSKTGVQQHPKNAQKRLFRQAECRPGKNPRRHFHYALTSFLTSSIDNPSARAIRARSSNSAFARLTPYPEDSFTRTSPQGLPAVSSRRVRV